jgi:hypothetical protein
MGARVYKQPAWKKANMRMKTCPLQLTAALFVLLPLTTPAATLCVDVNGTNATPPYNDWTTAATNIQDAVDAATDGDTILVTNGVYQKKECS